MRKNTFIGAIVMLGIGVVVSSVHRLYRYMKKDKKKHHHYPQFCPPLVTGLKIGSISANNNTIILKGKKMSVSLVGKQEVVYNVIPLTTDESGNQVPIDLNVFTLDQLFQSGSIQGSMSDLSIASVVQDASNPLSFTVTSVEDASGVSTLTVIGRDINGGLVSVTDDVTVTLAQTTTSTSTTSTTTLPVPTIPLVSGLGLQAGTPTDVV